MSWYPVPRLGPAGGELDLVCQVTDVDIVEDNVEVEQRNLAGADLKSYLRQNVPVVTLSLARMTDGLVSILRGFQATLKPLNFIYNKALAMKYLMATSATTTSIVIPPTSASGVVITGVFLQTDAQQSGTNYFSAGSTFDPVSGTITLATALPAANTDVWVNYSFTGLSCWPKIKSLKPHRGISAGLWEGQLELTGS